MSVSVAARFNGPPDSGNGGYAAGSIAAAIGEPVKVRLVQPVPMDRRMNVVPNASGGWDVHAELEQGPALIATATAHVPQVVAPHAPSWIEAFGASRHFVGFAAHAFPTCFVCGPARAEGDGLRIFPGSVPGANLLAAPWRPAASLAGSDGKLRPEFVWAALDCPGYFASCTPGAALLGELSVHIDHVPAIDEPCVVTAWSIAADGRKRHAGTALYDSTGARCALGVATWIQLKSPAKA